MRGPLAVKTEDLALSDISARLKLPRPAEHATHRSNAVCDKSTMAHGTEDLALRTPLQPFIPLRQNDIANYRAPGAFRKGLLSRSISTLVRSNSSKITDGAMMDEGGVMPVELI